MGGIVGRLLPRVRGHAVGRDPGLAGGVAHHHADDVRAAAAAGDASAAGAGSTRGASAASRRCSAATSARLGVGAATTARSRCSCSLGTVAPQRLSLRDRSQGLLPAAGHRPAHRRASRPTRAFRSRRCGRSSPSSSTSCAPTRRSRASSASPAARSGNTGSMFVTLKPLAERSETADQDRRAAAPAARAGARREPLPAAGAGHPHRRPAEQRAVPVHAAGRRPRRAARPGSRGSARRSRSCPSSPTSTPTSRTRGCRPRS